MKDKLMRTLGQFSQAILAPLTYLPAAGLLLAVGALLTSAPLSQVFPVLEWAPVRLVGQLLYQGMLAVLHNLSLLLCVGIAAARARTRRQEAAMLALMGYLVSLTACNVTLRELGLLADPAQGLELYGTGQTTVLGVQVMDLGVTGGVVLGFVSAWLFNHASSRRFSGAAGQLYSGVRWAFLWEAAAAVLFGAGSCYFWPPVQRAIGALTGWIAASGEAGVFLYGFLERLLIPLGLHHLVYMPFQFSALGGVLTVGANTYTGAYSIMMTEYSLGLPFSDSMVWMYTGFTKTFGYWGVAAAFIFCAKPGARRTTAASLLPLALSASVASITEPLDFLFCFSCPVLWVAHAALAGGFMVLLQVLDVTAFSSNLFASLLLNLSAGADATRYPLFYLLGVVQVLAYFGVFTVLIRVLDLPTPGRFKAVGRLREHWHTDPAMVCQLIEALGGPDNVQSLSSCFTRLRITVADPALLKADALLELPHRGMVRRGGELQLVCGLHAGELCRAVEAQLLQQMAGIH